MGTADGPMSSLRIAVVGENGAFYFWHDAESRKLRQRFLADEATRAANAARLKEIAATILDAVPGCALASDQFCRIADIAIDFCEDVPALPGAAGGAAQFPGLQMLPDGALLAQAQSAGMPWWLLQPATTRWCPVSGVALPGRRRR